MVNAYPRESVEFQPVKITRDGLAITTGLSFAIAVDGARPVTFTAATVLNDEPGVMISGLAAGTYRIFARLDASPEIPVIDCGYFYIT